MTDPQAELLTRARAQAQQWWKTTAFLAVLGLLATAFGQWSAGMIVGPHILSWWDGPVGIAFGIGIGRFCGFVK